MLKIIGGGLAGSVIASMIPGSVIYERDAIGGLCRDNANYQDFIHVLHTKSRNVWDFVNRHTLVRPHRAIMQSYVNGELKQWPPTEINDIVAKEQIFGYSKKMWGKTTPPEAVQRITTSQDGFMFLENYQGIPDFRELFSSLTQDTQIVKRDIKDGDLDGKIVLTGAIDEYFHYCFGELPYRGMQAVHYESEIGLTADAVTFPDKKIPFQRLVDYQRLGYKGQWLGVESACNAKHYPVRNVDSSKLYNKYKRLADEKGIKLCGRLATYHYMDMDEVILQAIKTAKGLKCLG